MAKKTTKKTKTEDKTNTLAIREYTDKEKTRIARYEERAKKKPIEFKSVKSDSNEINVAFKDPDEPLLKVKLSEAFGTADRDIWGHLLEQIVQTFGGVFSADSRNDKLYINAANTAMSILGGIEPQDELEAMLAVQMISVHNIAMKTMGAAILGGQTFEGRQANMNHAAKMLNTFVAQLEAFKKYRTGGQQKMIVEHVHVNEGGQAIVGTVNQGGGVNNKNNE